MHTCVCVRTMNTDYILVWTLRTCVQITSMYIQVHYNSIGVGLAGDDCRLLKATEFGNFIGSKSVHPDKFWSR